MERRQKLITYTNLLDLNIIPTSNFRLSSMNVIALRIYVPLEAQNLQRLA